MTNQVNLIGNLGEEPQLHTTENGKTKVSFSLATNERYKNKMGEQVDHTEWHKIIMWGAFAETVVKYLNKGSKVAISGKIAYRKYEKDNETKYMTEIVAKDILFLDNAK